MQYISRKELLETEGVTIFTYNLNTRAIKMFEFGAICLLIIAALIYPMTHFDPPQWKAAPIALGIASIAAYFTAQKWRAYVKKEYVGWDATNLYITQGSKGVAVVPWKKLTLNNSGLKDQSSGSVINIHLPNEPVVPLRLVAGFIILSKFQDVLATILTHIKQNMIESGEIEPKAEQADAKDEVKAEQTDEKDEVKNEQADAKDDVKNEQADAKDDVKAEQADAKDEVKNEQADAKDDVKNEQADAKDEVKAEQADA